MKHLAWTFALLLVSGCGGSSSSQPYAPPVTPAPPPSATPSPAVTLSAPSLGFTSPGYTLTFVASEIGYTGTLTATSADCAGIATVSPATGVGPSAAFGVTASHAGQCHVVVSDASGTKATLTVDVTTLSGTVD